ncbi:MAG: SRPBCC family protein [Halomonadaceae bacterium]|nr:MAG: SRPBCC family protein [Halomonadaceae bacterium]
MKTIVVKRLINAPIEQVFEMLSDHAGYTRFPGVKGARLLTKGKDDPNGDGAVRRVDLGAVWFEEVISNFQRPVGFDYRILRSRPPIEHEHGGLRLEETAAGTQVTWTSTLQVKVPLIGPLLTTMAVNTGEKAFGSMLKAIDKKLQNG